MTLYENLLKFPLDNIDPAKSFTRVVQEIGICILLLFGTTVTGAILSRFL